MKSFIKYHIETLRLVVSAVPASVWFLPPVTFLVLYGLTASPLVWFMSKQIQEIVAPTIVGIAALAALSTHIWIRQYFTLMTVLFVWSLFLRELHLDFTEHGIYLALLGLCWWASSKRNDLISFGISRQMAFFFSAALLTYALTDIVDRKVLRPLEFVLGPESDWQHQIEETGESLGHLFVFGFVLCTLWRGAFSTAHRQTAEPNAP